MSLFGGIMRASIGARPAPAAGVPLPLRGKAVLCLTAICSFLRGLSPQWRGHAELLSGCRLALVPGAGCPTMASCTPPLVGETPTTIASATSCDRPATSNTPPVGASRAPSAYWHPHGRAPE